MRFDLEISNLHTDLVYISEGQDLPAGAVPLYYISMDTKDKVPSDFLSIENKVDNDNLVALGYQTVEGPTFAANSNKFYMTHMATYSIQGNAKVPLFFKHVIADKVHEDAIRILDYFGIQIPREEYLVEEKDDFITNIYINKYNKILFVEYVSDNRIYKKLLDLQPIFTEVGWEDVMAIDAVIPAYKYMITDNYIQTSYPGTLYLSFQYESSLMRLPSVNIQDDWYLGILNTTFSIQKQVEGMPDPVTFNYSVPEYYFQQSSSEGYLRRFTEKKAKKLFENYIKLQTPVLRDKSEDIYIYVYDFYTNTLKYAITTNHDQGGKLYKDNIYYLYTDDYNADGVIGLPIKLATNDVCYATYWIYDEYYEFRFLNLNSPTLNAGGYFGIYLLPNVTETEESVYFARIGIPRTVPIVNGIITQDMQFETVEEYESFIATNNLYNIAVISIFGNYVSTILDTKDMRIKGGEIVDREEASRSTVDMLYKDIIDGLITIPTNDTLIANINADSLLANGKIKFEGDFLDLDSKAFLEKALRTIKSNLDASTMPIIDLVYTEEIPATDTIDPSDIETIVGWN